MWGCGGGIAGARGGGGARVGSSAVLGRGAGCGGFFGRGGLVGVGIVHILVLVIAALRCGRSDSTAATAARRVLGIASTTTRRSILAATRILVILDVADVGVRSARKTRVAVRSARLGSSGVRVGVGLLLVRAGSVGCRLDVLVAFTPAEVLATLALPAEEPATAAPEMALRFLLLDEPAPAAAEPVMEAVSAALWLFPAVVAARCAANLLLLRPAGAVDVARAGPACCAERAVERRDEFAILERTGT